MTDDPYTLDATGLLCPLPVLKARKRLQPLAVGDTLTVRADDPAAVIDMPHFCAEAGHDLVSSDVDSAVQVYVIRKGP
jgi:tRNA 2-thiouridine synthesizing protein A